MTCIESYYSMVFLWLAFHHKLLWNFLWLSCFHRSPYLTFYDFPVFLYDGILWLLYDFQGAAELHAYSSTTLVGRSRNFIVSTSDGACLSLHPVCQASVILKWYKMSYPIISIWTSLGSLMFHSQLGTHWFQNEKFSRGFCIIIIWEWIVPGSNFFWENAAIFPV